LAIWDIFSYRFAKINSLPSITAIARLSTALLKKIMCFFIQKSYIQYIAIGNLTIANLPVNYMT